jgi:hypothetical protein
MVAAPKVFKIFLCCSCINSKHFRKQKLLSQNYLISLLLFFPRVFQFVISFSNFLECGLVMFDSDHLEHLE